MARKICEKCKREMEDTNFYTYKDGSKFELCKACLTLHVDNFDQQTFLWILEKADVPYIPQEWNILRDRAYAKNPQKMNGMSVIGKYLSKMKLKQWKKYTWADSKELQQEKKKALAAKAEEEAVGAQMARKQFENGEISQAQYRTMVDTIYQKEHEYIMNPMVRDPIGTDNMFNQNNFISQDDLPNPADSLTLEDKQYLAMKWGRTYRPAEWIQLQQNYNDMMQSFDISDADSKKALIFICKTNLKMDQALDCGDIESFQKLSKINDIMRKSAKFTAAQNKNEKTGVIDSVGQLVAFCQKNKGQIPRFEIKTPLDKIDEIIEDQQKYLKNLVYEDTSLARQIEDYIKEAKAAIARKQDEVQAKEQGYDTPQLTEEDILDYKEFLKQEQELTQEEIQEGGNKT